MTDTTTTDPLDDLFAEAHQRGWRPDTGRHARPGCWQSERGTSEIVVPADVADLRIIPVSAHTGDDSLRAVVGGADRARRAALLLRLFLGWRGPDPHPGGAVPDNDQKGPNQ